MTCTLSTNHGERGDLPGTAEESAVFDCGRLPLPAESPQLRLVTYNVHGCRGTDGRLSVSRVGDVLAACEADLIVLQELDVGRSRSEQGLQPEEIAARLGMHFVFCPTVSRGKEHYGHAVLGRRPLRSVRSEALPRTSWPRPAELRGALWVEAAIGHRTLQIIGTHLGLAPWERWMQVEVLLGARWIGAPEFVGPRVVCGDLNSAPGSPVYERLSVRLRDAQRLRARRGARPTYPSRLPLLRIDHVLVGDELRVVDTFVVDSPEARMASDHLPLVCDLVLAKEENR